MTHTGSGSTIISTEDDGCPDAPSRTKFDRSRAEARFGGADLPVRRRLFPDGRWVVTPATTSNSVFGPQQRLQNAVLRWRVDHHTASVPTFDALVEGGYLTVRDRGRAALLDAYTVLCHASLALASPTTAPSYQPPR